ncbi:MAG TPA: hypothetical protein PLO76_09395, partial [Elusimicrobiota bacterium]|nr:hypothetical protein [Elusimicrobiota bacterium]
MPHFYVPPENIRGSYFWLNREESEHVARVLRKQPGEEIQLFDGADRSFRGVLETVTPSKVDGRVVAEEKQETSRYRAFDQFVLRFAGHHLPDFGGDQGGGP